MARMLAVRYLLASALWLVAPSMHEPVGLCAGERVAAKRPLSPKDAFLLDRPQSAVLSPDGTRLAYTRVSVDPSTKEERHSLWVVDGERAPPRPVEPGEPDGRAPVFSPDGDWIAFLSTRPRPSGWQQTPSVPRPSFAATDIWLIPAVGGKAKPLAGPKKPYGRVFSDPWFYARIAFSHDGTQLAFIADDGLDIRTLAEKEADASVVRTDQGERYTGFGPAQIWLAHVDLTRSEFVSERVVRLTDDDVSYGDLQWAPDDKALVVHANRTPDREAVLHSINKNYDLWMLDIQTRALTQLTHGSGPEISPRFSPDGKRLVCLSSPRNGPHLDVFNLAVVRLDDHDASGPKTNVVYDYHATSSTEAPFPPPSFPPPQECWENNEYIVYDAAVGTKTQTIRLHLKSQQAQVVDDAAQERLAKTKRYFERARKRHEWTPVANAFLKDRLLGETRVLRWKNDEGRNIDGLLLVPHPSIAQPPYKFVLYPHGGPHGRSTESFNFRAQVFVGQGYAVLQPNFRGSLGYGRTFLDADRFDFGGGDVRDILAGVEHLIKESIIDAKRQFVYGSSYGGYLTCWLVGHTTQFKAAVAQNAVTELNIMWGRSDIQSWTEWEMGGKPWEIPDVMRRHSPLTYVTAVETPTLVLHATEDRRVPIAMGHLFHQFLKGRGVPTEMVLYHNCGHSIHRPRQLADVLQRSLDWLAKYDSK